MSSIIPRVGTGEPAHLLVFLTESLHDTHTAQVLAADRVHPVQPLLHPAKAREARGQVHGYEGRRHPQHQHAQPQDGPEVLPGDAGVDDAGHDRGLQQVTDGLHGQTRYRGEKGHEVLPDVGAAGLIRGRAPF
jgi:hypothetical protein